MQTQASMKMLEAFRALGGTAENIRLDDGNGGLSPCDAERPVRLRVPENLLFPFEAIEFAKGFLRLKDAEDTSQGARNFFEHYEGVFGQGIFAQAAAAAAALDSLSAAVKEVLSGDVGLRGLFEGDCTKRIENRFLARRAIRMNERRVIAPILELATHDPEGLAIEYDSGIRIAGPARDGIRIFHPFHDALAIYQRFGFAAAQPAAFSLPMSFVSDGIEISIERKLHLGDRRGDVTVPQLNVVGRDRVQLSHLMIGHRKFPRLARGIFRSRMRDAKVNDPDGQFDRIAQENTGRLLKLLSVLEREEDQTTLSLRKTVRFQLEAMSWSIGAREI